MAEAHPAARNGVLAIGHRPPRPAPAARPPVRRADVGEGTCLLCEFTEESSLRRWCPLLPPARLRAWRSAVSAEDSASRADPAVPNGRIRLHPEPVPTHARPIRELPSDPRRRWRQLSVAPRAAQWHAGPAARRPSRQVLDARRSPIGCADANRHLSDARDPRRHGRGSACHSGLRRPGGSCACRPAAVPRVLSAGIPKQVGKGSVRNW